MTCFGGSIGNALSIEGRAIRRDYQALGLGSLSLRELTLEEKFDAVVSVTRNPAVLRLMRRHFYTVSPDLTDPDPLHYMGDPMVSHVVDMYGEHIGADPRDLPFVHGRYTGGLYGYADPGRAMGALPQIADKPESGIIMVAMDEARLL